MTTPAAGGAITAGQAALAAEYAAVYGYGVVGARIGDDRRPQATAAYDAHRARRDAMRRALRDLGAEPVAADPGYELPFPVPDAAAAVRLAALIEDRVADAYADLVPVAGGDLRRSAATALRDAAVRAVGWRGTGVAFPGLPERASTASASPSPDAL
jgi:hypothetical protein